MEDKDLRRDFLIYLDQLTLATDGDRPEDYEGILNKLYSIIDRANAKNPESPDIELKGMIEPCVNIWLRGDGQEHQDADVLERIRSWREEYLSEKYLESRGYASKKKNGMTAFVGCNFVSNQTLINARNETNINNTTTVIKSETNIINQTPSAWRDAAASATDNSERGDAVHDSDVPVAEKQEAPEAIRGRYNEYLDALSFRRDSKKWNAVNAYLLASVEGGERSNEEIKSACVSLEGGKAVPYKGKLSLLIGRGKDIALAAGLPELTPAPKRDSQPRQRPPRL